MSKKLNKEFQERINNNKSKPIGKNNRLELLLNECMVYVDKENKYIDTKELKTAIEEIIYSKEKIDKGEVISLSKVCDIFYDLKVTSSRIINNKKELYFSIC